MEISKNKPPMSEYAGNGLKSKRESSESAGDKFIRDPATNAEMKKIDGLVDLRKEKLKEVVLSGRDKALREKILGERESYKVGMRKLWDFKDVYFLPTDMVVDTKNKIVYAGRGSSKKWYVNAFSTDGKEKWCFREEPATCSPAIDKEGNVFIRTEKNLYKLDRDGNKKWKFPITGSFLKESPPVVTPDGTVYLIMKNPLPKTENADHLRLIAIKDGKEKWHYDAAFGTLKKPQVLVGGDGTVYLAAGKEVKGGISRKKKLESCLIALNPDGTEKFTRQVDDGWVRYSDSCLSEGKDGSIYAIHGELEHQVSAFTPGGKEKWHRDIETLPGLEKQFSISHAPTFDRHGNLLLVVNVFGPKSYLAMLDRKGNIGWSKTFNQFINTKPQMGADGKIYAMDHTRNLHILDEDGKTLETYNLRKTGEGAEPGSGHEGNFTFGENGELYINAITRLLAFQPDLSKWRPKIEIHPTEGAVHKSYPSKQIIEVGDEHVIIGGVKLERMTKSKS